MSAPAPGSNLNRISIVLGFLGLFITGYLTWTHYQRVLPPCTAGSNCDVVLTHPTAKLFGIPVALLGLVGYVLVTGVAVMRSRLAGDPWKKSVWLGVGLTGFGAAFSAVYTYIALALIQATCQWCLASFAAMLCLFFLHLSMAFGPKWTEDRGVLDIPATAVGAGLAAVLFFFAIGRVNAEGLEGLPNVNVGNKTRAEILPAD
ncbi:MAG: vitamin K epoxide reductase family protein, partial [Fimbriimonadaceae bacterium]|nr:vitamin K epoxide reductase family protein [Fimbriimonadaceae bacterium]